MVASGLQGQRGTGAVQNADDLLGRLIPLSDPPIERCVGAIHAGHMPLSEGGAGAAGYAEGFLPT